MPKRIPIHVPLGVQSERHARRKAANQSSTGLTTTQRGYTWTWRKQSKAHLIANPMCVHCAARGVHTVARHVDHVDANPMAYNPRIQSLCIECHSRKTVLENGGFGRSMKQIDTNRG